MNEVSSDIAGLTRRLIVFDSPTLDRDEDVVKAVERAWERLRRQLTVLIGATGFDALFARAVALARARHPLLASVSYDTATGHDLIGLNEIADAHEPTDLLDALVSIMAYFLAVLVRLIGADLVGRLVQVAWPELPPEDVELSLETHE